MVETIILGTIGIDTISTPLGKKENILGGSAVYASFAASFFTKPGMISVKGEDLPLSELDFLKERNVSLEGIRTQGKNFRWTGEYTFDMNEAKTLNTELNSLGAFNPIVPKSYKKAKYTFIGNLDPVIQIKVMDQLENPKLITLDTMNFWIDSKKNKLLDAIKKADILIINEGEARQLFNTSNLVKAGKDSLKLGLDACIIKKGEHGSLLFEGDEIFNCPGYPLENLVDPTGCGDSFGGSFIGYYAKTGNIRKAIVYGSIIASFNAEDFGLNAIKKISIKDIEKRYRVMQKLREF